VKTLPRENNILGNTWVVEYCFQTEKPKKDMKAKKKKCF
jgi:hypothetical protein